MAKNYYNIKCYIRNALFCCANLMIFNEVHNKIRPISLTPTVDSVASVLQSIAIACLCIVINNDAGKVRFSPLVIISALFVLIYYAGWAVYYSGINTPWVILLLTVPPCLALILYATDRKNVPALILAIGFAICHLVFAIVNFIR